MGAKLAGLLLYIARVYSLFAGALFFLLVTRKLDVSEFGEWKAASGLLASVTAFSTFIGFWVLRFRSRGFREATMTGLFLSLICALAASVALLLVSLQPSFANVSSWVVAFMALYTFPVYAISTLSSALMAVNPYRVALAEIVFETVKVLLALLITYTCGITLQAVLTIVLLSYLTQVATMLLSLKSDLTVKVNLELAKRWIKFFWFNAWLSLALLLSSLDVVLLSQLAGPTATAFYTIGLVYLQLIKMAKRIGGAFYPEMLRDSSAANRTGELLRVITVLMLLPVVGIITYAEQLLFVLEPEKHSYLVATDAFRVLTIAYTLSMYTSVLVQVVRSIDKTDVESTSPLALVRSKMFVVSNVQHLEAVLKLLLILALVPLASTPQGAAVMSACSALIASTFSLALAVVITRRAGVTLGRPYYIAKYLLACLPVFLLRCLLGIPAAVRIRELLLLGLVSALIYFALVYLMDKWFRSNMKQLIQVVISLPR